MAKKMTAPPDLPTLGLSLRVIPDDALLRLEEVRELLGLSRSTLRREVRLGRLRVSRRGGWYWTCGSWLREWIASGERKPSAASAAAAAS